MRAHVTPPPPAKHKSLTVTPHLLRGLFFLYGCRNKCGMTRFKSAFSLVELSIVLVILGLLVGGVLSGQSLIRAAELRAVSSEYARYATAIQTFRDKYFALPGDMTNATSFWLSAGGTGSNAACAAEVSTTAATCNGNGDGLVSGIINGNAAFSEEFRAWQHLANAGLIEGSYTGTGASAVAGTNTPRSRMGNSGWGIAYTSAFYFAEGNWGTQSTGNAFFFGANADTMRGVALNPTEAWNIDVKNDDGLPGSAIVQITDKSGVCVTSSTAPSAYALSVTTKSCALQFMMR